MKDSNNEGDEEYSNCEIRPPCKWCEWIRTIGVIMALLLNCVTLMIMAGRL